MKKTIFAFIFFMAPIGVQANVLASQFSDMRQDVNTSDNGAARLAKKLNGHNLVCKIGQDYLLKIEAKAAKKKTNIAVTKIHSTDYFSDALEVESTPNWFVVSGGTSDLQIWLMIRTYEDGFSDNRTPIPAQIIEDDVSGDMPTALPGLCEIK